MNAEYERQLHEAWIGFNEARLSKIEAMDEIRLRRREHSESPLRTLLSLARRFGYNRDGSDNTSAWVRNGRLLAEHSQRISEILKYRPGTYPVSRTTIYREKADSKAEAGFTVSYAFNYHGVRFDTSSTVPSLNGKRSEDNEAKFEVIEGEVPTLHLPEASGIYIFDDQVVYIDDIPQPGSFKVWTPELTDNPELLIASH